MFNRCKRFTLEPLRTSQPISRCLWYGGSDTYNVAPCKPQAGEQLYRWPVQWCSGCGFGAAVISEGTKPLSRFIALRRGSGWERITREEITSAYCFLQAIFHMSSAAVLGST